MGQYGYGSFGVDSRRVALQTRAAYEPDAYGANSASLAVTAPNVPPGLGAPNVSASAMNGSYGVEAAGGALDSIGGYGTADNNGYATAMAAMNPYSFRHAPMWGAILLLLIGVIGLHLTAFRSS